MRPFPARSPLLAGLVPVLLSGCMAADPTLGMLPRADVGRSAGRVAERSAPAPLTPSPAMRARVGAPVATAMRAPLPPVEAQPLPPPDMAGQSLPPPAPAGQSFPPPAPAGQAPQVAIAAAPALPPAAQGAPAPSGIREIQFLPIVGAPAPTVAAVAAALARHAPGQGVSIVAAASGTAPTRLKGYLSAVNEGGATSVIYVWDVLDAAGERINRIQGQERVGASAPDPWSVVGPDALDAIAKQTLAQAARL